MWQKVKDIYKSVNKDVEHFLSDGCGVGHMNENLQMLRTCLIRAWEQPRELKFAKNIIKVCVEGLQDGLLVVHECTIEKQTAVKYKHIFISVLQTLQNGQAFGQMWTNQQVTRYLTECCDELRYSVDAVETLLEAGLVNMRMYDVALAQLMEAGTNYMAIKLGMHLLNKYILEVSSNIITAADLCHVIEVLEIVSKNYSHPPEGLRSLMQQLRCKFPKGIFVKQPPIVRTEETSDRGPQPSHPKTETQN